MFYKNKFLNAWVINIIFIQLAKSLDFAIQILLAEVKYFIYLKVYSSDKWLIQGYDIFNIKPNITTIIML